MSEIKLHTFIEGICDLVGISIRQDDDGASFSPFARLLQRDFPSTFIRTRDAVDNIFSQLITGRTVLAKNTDAFEDLTDLYIELNRRNQKLIREIIDLDEERKIPDYIVIAMATLTDPLLTPLEYAGYLSALWVYDCLPDKETATFWTLFRTSINNIAGQNTHRSGISIKDAVIKMGVPENNFDHLYQIQQTWDPAHRLTTLDTGVGIYRMSLDTRDIPTDIVTTHSNELFLAHATQRHLLPILRV